MDDFFGILPFCLAFFLVALLSVQNKKNSAVIMCWILFLFSALRYDVGWDYPEYYSMADGYRASKVEGYEFIPKMFLLLSSSIEWPYLFFILSSFVTIFALHQALKESDNPSLSLFAYFSIPIFFMESLSTVRFHMALSLVLLAEYYAIKKRYVLFVLFLIIAVNCHISALIVLLFPLLQIWKPNRIGNLFILMFSFFVSKYMMTFLEKVPFIPSEVTAYIALAGEITGFSLLPILFLLLNIFHILYYDRFVAFNPSLKLYIYAYNIGCCIMLLFSFEVTLSSRLSKYFMILILFIIPYYSQIFRYKKLTSQLLYISFFILFAFNLFVSAQAFYSGAVEKNQYIPYQTIFFHNESFK